MVTHSEDALVQEQEVPGWGALKEVAFDYLALVPPKAAFWVLMVVALVASIGGIVLAVKTIKSVKRSVRTYARRISQDLKKRASGSKDERSLMDQVDRLRSQNWRGIYAKVHMGLCLLTSGVGIALAAQEHASMEFPANLVAFAAFEGLAVAIMMRIEDRAKQALPFRSLLVLYWGTIGVAAAVQTTHVEDEVGQVIWAAFTLSGGLVYHLHMATLRADKETELRQWEQRWLKRKMSVGRWLRPFEAIQVVWEKAADTEMSTDEATRRVRERTAGRRSDRALDRVMWSVWRLGRAQKARRVWGFGWLVDWVESNHLVLTQQAIAQARLHAAPEKLEDLLRRLEAMDLAGQLSGIRSRSDARLIYGSFAGGSAAGSVGRLEQFALPSSEPKGFEPADSGSAEQVRVVFVGESSGSGFGSGSGEEFEPAGSGSVSGFGSGAPQGFESEGSVRDTFVGSTPVKGEFEPQSSTAPQGFEPADSGSGSGFGSPEGVGFEPVGSVQVEQFESVDEVESQGSEPGIWEHSTDGWTPPTVDQAWERAADDDGWPTLFEVSAVPARSLVPATLVDQVREDNVQRVRTMEELRQEVRQAWEQGHITLISSEQIYRTLKISKKRAAKLRDWFLREELRSALVEGKLDKVSPAGVCELLKVARKQAVELLVWAEQEGLVVMKEPAEGQAQ